jgi:hypothetical protein
VNVAALDAMILACGNLDGCVLNIRYCAV